MNSHTHIPNRTALKQSLRLLIAETAEKTEPEGGLKDDELLFGSDSRLNMDSLDALQLSMLIQKNYGIRIADSKETRRAFACIDTLTDYLLTRMEP